MRFALSVLIYAVAGGAVRAYKRDMVEHELSRERVFEGKLLRVDVLDVELANGRRSRREVVRHPGAAVVLCRRPDDMFVWVRQFRMAAGELLLEAVAGTLDAGEAPATCAQREVREETGYEPVRLVSLGEAFPSPGYTEELLHFFYAEVPIEGGEQSPDDDEQVEVALLGRNEIEAMMARGEVRDAKTLAVWMLYTQRLRAAGGEL
jgi:ADP-ribose pyrophosphatase